MMTVERMARKKFSLTAPLARSFRRRPCGLPPKKLKGNMDAGEYKPCRLGITINQACSTKTNHGSRNSKDQAPDVMWSLLWPCRFIQSTFLLFRLSRLGLLKEL